MRIYNGCERDKDGNPIIGEHGVPKLRFEGFATIIRHLDVDGYYRVKFDGEAKHYQRFVNDDAAA